MIRDTAKETFQRFFLILWVLIFLFLAILRPWAFGLITYEFELFSIPVLSVVDRHPAFWVNANPDPGFL
jgi:hypothetical protein